MYQKFAGTGMGLTETVLHKSTYCKHVIHFSNYYDKFTTMRTMKTYT
jgi:hypothetical protein